MVQIIKPPRKPEKCNHLNFTINGSDPAGMARCLECNVLIHITNAFNNLANHMRLLMIQCQDVIEAAKASKND